MINLDTGLFFDVPLISSSISFSSKIQFYGSMPFNFPTGRPNDTASFSSVEFLTKVQLLKNNTQEFNFLLNGVFGSSEIALYDQYFQWIVSEIKPAIITFSSPQVYHHLVQKYNYTSFEISTIAGIKDQKSFELFMSVNSINPDHIKKIVLHHDATQSFSELQKFSSFLNKRNIIPRVLVTESCYLNCPLRKVHYKSFSSSRSNSDENFYQVHCIGKRLLQPETLLDLSGFLLPEQLLKYSQNTGITAFKLSGRSESPEWVNNTTKAYLKGKSPENLFSIIVFTAPHLKKLGLKLDELFYLNSQAYLSMYEELVLIKDTRERTIFLQRKAKEFFQNGLLRINSKGASYIIEDDKLIMKSPGEYLHLLKNNANAKLRGTVFHDK